MKLRRLLLALALVGCEQAPSKPNDLRATPAVVARQRLRLPKGFDQTVAEAVIVGTREIDASSLGAEVEVYLVTRRRELSVMVVGRDGAMREVLAKIDDDALGAAEPRALDLFAEAPAWRNPSTIVLAHTVREQGKRPQAYVVARAGDRMEVWVTHDEGRAWGWGRVHTLVFAPGAAVTTPIADLPRPAPVVGGI